jgi:putative nucleotidyltransferase with HDIG domain
MNREEAINLVKENIKKENLFKHILAVEAIMRGVAEHLNEDIKTWGLVGLLHDIDFEKTMNNPKNHTIIAENLLKGKVDEKIIKAIKSHNFESTGVIPETKMEKALIASDAISGLIVAAALIIPSKKLEDVKVESVGKRFKEKDFARKCSRERMLVCEHIGIPREKFFEIALESMQGISDELGL